MTQVCCCKVAYTRYDVPWFIEEMDFKQLICLAYQVFVKFQTVVFRLDQWYVGYCGWWVLMRIG
jgi:hypothetical protein